MPNSLMTTNTTNNKLKILLTRCMHNDDLIDEKTYKYLDDIFMIWTEGEDTLKTFIDYINYIHPTIKFLTHEYSNSSNQSLPFLDVLV